MTCRRCDLCGILVSTTTEIANEPTWCQTTAFLCKACKAGQYPPQDAMIKMGHLLVHRSVEGDVHEIQDSRYPTYHGRRMIITYSEGRYHYAWLPSHNKKA